MIDEPLYSWLLHKFWSRGWMCDLCKCRAYTASNVLYTVLCAVLRARWGKPHAGRMCVAPLEWLVRRSNIAHNGHCAYAVAINLLKHFDMKNESIANLKKFYEMIAPHINGHRTASTLFWESVKELESEQLHKHVVVPSLPPLMNSELNNGWNFDYQTISTLTKMIEETGEEISMEQVDAVLLALYQRQ